LLKKKNSGRNKLIASKISAKIEKGANELHFPKILAGPKCNTERGMGSFKSENYMLFWDTLNMIIDKYPNSKISGGIFLYPRQQLFLAHLIQNQLLLKAQRGDHGPFRICETGFGGGHLTSLFLSLNDNIDVISFDKFDRRYHPDVVDHIKSNFGEGRLHIVKGDSCITVPQYLKKAEFPGCDFLHGSSLCKSDNIDLIRHSKRGTILSSTAMNSLSDRAVYFGPGAQWRTLRQNRCITNITCFKDEVTVLDKAYIFASDNDKEIMHSFCFAVNAGVCRYSEAARTDSWDTRRNNEQTKLDLFDFCPDVELEPPI